MGGGGIHALELVFLLLLIFVVMFAALARKLQTPYPIVLVIAGLFLSFVPGIPKFTLNPDVIFLVVLPPLLYYGAWITSWREFKFNFVSIFLLAFGLVAFTVAGVAATAKWVFAGLDLSWVRWWRQPIPLRRLRSLRAWDCRKTSSIF